MKYNILITFFFFSLIVGSCDKSTSINIPREKEPLGGVNSTCNSADSQAVVTNVKVAGTENNYTFAVTIKSPDTGCQQYADWWEVITPDSVLIYRRILTHSHVSEQPFTRSGGPVKVVNNKNLIIRSHMNTLGYGCLVFSGSVETGFALDTIARNYASALSEELPLPSGCDF